MSVLFWDQILENGFLYLSIFILQGYYVLVIGIFSLHGAVSFAIAGSYEMRLQIYFCYT
jgi:hypothetical protein